MIDKPNSHGVKQSVDDLPVVCYVTVPVRLKSYNKKVDGLEKESLGCGFAIWWGADAHSDVSDNDGKKIKLECEALKNVNLI
jgi:hypothetical protein